jgi:DNA-directed RNA polymerase specialized sigma24 family protein
VTDEAQRTHDVDDAKLLNKVRAGDTPAFAILRRRHEQAARRLAGELTSSAGAADVLVAEAFDQVLSATQRGGGPTDAFRPYLLTALRQVSEGQAIIPAADTPGSGTPLMVQAFLSLPERWRAVLWHTEIEEISPAEVAPLFGLSLTGVTAVRRSARDGLRQAYLQLHRARVSQPECARAAARLGPFVRDAVPGSDSALVTGHLSECDDCRAAYTDLADIGLTLRTVVAPAVLGAAAAAYLAAAAHPAAEHPADAQAAAGDSMAGGAAAAAGRAWIRLPEQLSHATRPLRWLAAGAAAAIAVGATAFAVTLSSHDTSAAHQHSAADPAPVVATPSAPSAAATTAAVPAATTRAPRSHHHRAAAVSPAPAVTQSPPPAAAVRLAASIAVASQQQGRGAMVTFAVADTGSAATGDLTVSVALPPGSALISGGLHGQDNGPARGGFGGFGGWNCQPASGGAACQHGPVSAGTQTQDALFIVIESSTACGQPVGLTATSGSATASAQSPEVLRC